MKPDAAVAWVPLSADGAVAASAVPHATQKRASGVMGLRHFGHWLDVLAALSALSPGCSTSITLAPCYAGAGWELPASVVAAASAPPRLVRTTKDATASLVDTVAQPGPPGRTRW